MGEGESVHTRVSHVLGIPRPQLDFSSLTDRNGKTIPQSDFTTGGEFFFFFFLIGCALLPFSSLVRLCTRFLYNPPPMPFEKKDDLKWETIPSICFGLWFRGFILHILILQETPCRCGGALDRWPLVKRQTARNQKHDREDKQLCRSPLLARMAASSETSLVLMFTKAGPELFFV